MNSPLIKYNLLLAISDEHSISVFTEFLEDFNYSLKILASFEDVYNEYKCKKYDLVILTSLGLDAGQIIKCIVKLKMYDPKIKLLIISNYDKESFIESLAATGIDHIYELPLDFEYLHSGIQSLLHTPPIKK